MTAPRIGILALQGDVREHAASVQRLGARTETVRLPAQFDEIDALILPGGESTTMGRLLRVFKLLDPLRERLQDGMPTLSTCAGSILLSSKILDGRHDQMALGVLDLDVRRNGYGRQVESFETDLVIGEMHGGPFRAIFIRAPIFERVGSGVSVLATYDSKPVAIAQGRHIALSFHPEMTGDTRVHQLFIDLIATPQEHAA